MGGTTILLVEDHEDDIYLFRLSAQKAGLEAQAIWLDEPQRVQAYLMGTEEFWDRAQYPLPSILFLSDRLHRLPTLDLLAWWVQAPQAQSIPVVMLSDSLDPDFGQKAAAVGALECMSKPPREEDWQRLKRTMRANGLNSPFKEPGDPGISRAKG